jgi:topoisomerase IA-like protein
MAKITKTENDRFLRENVFATLMNFIPYDGTTEAEVGCYPFKRINDRQWGIILTDKNGDHRYIRIGAIVAELRDDMTAEELMQSEIDAYEQKQADKAEKAKVKEKKIAKDKARREAEAKAKESEQK